MSRYIRNVCLNKSISETFAPARKTSQFYQYVKSGNEFRYYFNGNTNEAKKAFQNIFKNREKASKLWDVASNSSRNFFESRGVKNLQDLLSKSNDLNSDLYNFIK